MDLLLLEWGVGGIIQEEEQKGGSQDSEVSAGQVVTIHLHQTQGHRVSNPAGCWGFVKARQLPQIVITVISIAL